MEGTKEKQARVWVRYHQLREERAVKRGDAELAQHHRHAAAEWASAATEEGGVPATSR